MTWHLIYNKLKILIDPRYFADGSGSDFVDMLKHYLSKTDPILCDVEFYYPTFIEERLANKRSFNSLNTKTVCITEPKINIDFFSKELIPDKVSRIIQNELLSLAVEYKIPFILSDFNVAIEEEVDLIAKYNISILNQIPLQKKIEAFLQGFYNYYKFNLIQGIDSPDLALAMSDPVHKKLYMLENKVRGSSLSEGSKERVRSFVHNRYIDILVTIERVIFYKIQQQISDIESGVLENKNSQFHGSIRYYLNYHLLLLWGYIDHMCLIINDLFEFGYKEEDYRERKKIGFRNFKDKQEYLKKLKCVDEDLYNFVLSTEFQEWLKILGQLRNKNAHMEMISPVPFLQETDASKISDEEIDAIIYKDHPPMEEEVARLLPSSYFEDRKVLDRQNYRISKMNKLLDHTAIVKEGLLDPVARISIDIENLNKLTEYFLKATEKAAILNSNSS
jgi:hypothetical protein